MYAGRIVEVGPTAELFAHAAHPYTRRLVQAIPTSRAAASSSGSPAGRRRRARARRAARSRRAASSRSTRAAPSEPPLREVAPGLWVECFRAAEVRRAPSRARAGSTSTSSGRHRATRCSRSTTSARPTARPGRARRHLQLEPARVPRAGRRVGLRQDHARALDRWPAPRVDRADLAARAAARRQRARAARARRAQAIQYVFQNPYGSLNPRKTVGQIVRQPLGVFGTATARGRRRVGEMLERVSLTAELRRPLPRPALRRRAPARRHRAGLVVSPTVLVCDEVTSALDVFVQAAIVELLAELQRDLGLAMLFVTHNLPLVRSIAQRVAVMSDGASSSSAPSSTAAVAERRVHARPARRHAVARDRDRVTAAPAVHETVRAGERAPEHPARDGGPARRRPPAGLRQCRRARAAALGAGDEGVVFESAYCASPLCAPSRFALLAGRMPSGSGAYDNAAELPAGTPTIAHVLRASRLPRRRSPARCTSSGPTSCTASRSG